MVDLLTNELWKPYLKTGVEAFWQILKILILYWVSRRFLSFFIRRSFHLLIERLPPSSPGQIARLKTLETLSLSGLRYTLLFIASLLLLKVLFPNLDPGSIVATAGVAGFAIGFGAQRLVRDIISGFFLLLEDQFAVGDYVAIGNITGVVEEIGLRITRIRDDAGRLNILANGDIGTVTNFSRGRYLLNLEVGTSAEVPEERVAQVVEEVACETVDQKMIFRLTFRGPIGGDAGKVVYRIDAEVNPKERISAEIKLRRSLRNHFTQAQIPWL